MPLGKVLVIPVAILVAPTTVGIPRHSLAVFVVLRHVQVDIAVAVVEHASVGFVSPRSIIPGVDTLGFLPRSGMPIIERRATAALLALGFPLLACLLGSAARIVQLGLGLLCGSLGFVERLASPAVLRLDGFVLPLGLLPLSLSTV